MAGEEARQQLQKNVASNLNKSWQQHPTRHQLYSHLPPIMKTIQARRTRHAGHCWRSRDELISDVLLWTPTYGWAKAGWPAQTYIQQLCEDMGCSPEDLREAMNNREKWWERVRDIHASSTTWWWWIYIDRLIWAGLDWLTNRNGLTKTAEFWSEMFTVWYLIGLVWFLCLMAYQPL